MKDPRGWKRMMFKGKKVWLRVDAEQRPLVENHKLLIKYQIDQDYEYWVPEKAVQPIDLGRLNKKRQISPVHVKALKAKAGTHKKDATPPEVIVAYTDGASSGNPGPSGIGIVLRFGSQEKEISEHIGTTTNNVAELTAIKTALEAIRKTEIPVCLYTDSQYCYGLLVLGWKAQKNEALVAATKKLIKKFSDLKLLKIKGHAKIAPNERADYLARKAAKKIPAS